MLSEFFQDHHARPHEESKLILYLDCFLVSLQQTNRTGRLVTEQTI